MSKQPTRMLMIAQHGDENVVWCSLNLFCEERIDITKCSTCRRHVPKEDTEGYIACNWPKAFAPRWKAMREDSQ